MFETPVFPVTEFYGTGRRETEKSFHVRLEKEEICKLLTDESFEPSYIQVSVRKKRKSKGAKKQAESDQDAHVEYIGLLSGARYDAQGNLLSKLPGVRLDRHDRTRHGNQFAHSKKLQTFYEYGLEELPRPPSPARVVRDSPNTSRLFEKLSDRSKTILGKNIDDRGTTVLPATEVLAEDTWPQRALRVRHASILNTLLQLALLKKDYGLASRVFALLIRTPGVDIRALWTIGLELLVQQREKADGERGLLDRSSGSDGLTNGDLHTLPHSYARRFDEEFLSWLIVNYPKLPNPIESQWKSWRPRAPDFYPYLILSLLRHGSPKEALSRLEELMLEAPYNENPLFYALCGIATMQMMAQTRRQAEDLDERQQLLHNLRLKAEKYFSHALEYGGTLPEDLLSTELEQLVEEDNGDDNVVGLPQDEDDVASLASNDSYVVHSDAEMEFSFDDD